MGLALLGCVCPPSENKRASLNYLEREQSISSASVDLSGGLRLGTGLQDVLHPSHSDYPSLVMEIFLLPALIALPHYWKCASHSDSPSSLREMFASAFCQPQDDSKELTDALARVALGWGPSLLLSLRAVPQIEIL